jgi:hypothetical protein
MHHHVSLVSRCWQGEVRNLDIPADEGYGKNGFPAWGIPPNGGLLFEIEVRARACLLPLLGFHPCSDFTEFATPRVGRDGFREQNEFRDEGLMHGAASLPTCMFLGSMPGHTWEFVTWEFV